MNDCSVRHGEVAGGLLQRDPAIDPCSRTPPAAPAADVTELEFTPAAAIAARGRAGPARHVGRRACACAGGGGAAESSNPGAGRAIVFSSPPYMSATRALFRLGRELRAGLGKDGRRRRHARRRLRAAMASQTW